MEGRTAGYFVGSQNVERVNKLVVELQVCPANPVHSGPNFTFLVGHTLGHHDPAAHFISVTSAVVTQAKKLYTNTKVSNRLVLTRFEQQMHFYKT